MWVTPFVGVWIETDFIYSSITYWLSHPSWVCGLKLGLPVMTKLFCVSHPSWVCGLKPVYSAVSLLRSVVTPFVGVWIETLAV